MFGLSGAELAGYGVAVAFLIFLAVKFTRKKKGGRGGSGGGGGGGGGSDTHIK